MVGNVEMLAVVGSALAALGAVISAVVVLFRAKRHNAIGVKVSNRPSIRFDDTMTEQQIAEKLADISGEVRGNLKGDPSLYYDRLGEELVAQGNLEGALKSYQESLAIRENLASNPKPAFRSKYEDGIRDVRLLYPAAFYHRITRLPRLTAPPPEPDESDGDRSD